MPGIGAFCAIRPGDGSGLFYRLQGLHEASYSELHTDACVILPSLLITASLLHRVPHWTAITAAVTLLVNNRFFVFFIF